jgi:adenylate cyclase
LPQEGYEFMGGVGTSERDTEVDPQSGLPLDKVREQLGRVLASPEFHATDKMRDFLRYVVEERLAGRSHRLKGYTIAVNVFGRSEDFDATNDPIVRIQAGRLRRALERYYLVGGVSDPILIDIPKGRYIPRFTIRSAPERGKGEPVERLARSPAEPARGPSLAVLPFENLTDDPQQLALTTGLTEELITELTRFQDISVIPCQPARRPAGLPSEPAELGQGVGARFVLQGSVRRDTEAIKVAAHLTDTVDRRRVWADSHTLPLEAGHLIATQEDIAQRVVTAIASEYGIIARRLSAESRKKRPAELETYEAMLRYYGHQIEPSPESAAACFAALRAAADKEPEYGSVWSALATLHCQMYTLDVPGFDGALDTAIEYARKGVFLEPGSQLGRLILAYASYLAEDADGFREESETALNLNPNSPYTLGAVGYFHIMHGDVDQGLPLLDRAIDLNPCHPRWFHAGYVIDHLLRGDDERALAEASKHRPFISFWDDVMIAAIFGRLDRKDEARPHIDRVVAGKPDLPDRVRELIGRALKIGSLVDDLVEGLSRAGMPVGGSPGSRLGRDRSASPPAQRGTDA